MADLLVVIVPGEYDSEYAVQELGGGGTARGCVAGEQGALVERNQAEGAGAVGNALVGQALAELAGPVELQV